MARGKHGAPRDFYRRRATVPMTVLAMLAALLVFPGVAAATPDPISVTVAGSFQEELGCPGDWQPDCATTHLTYADGVWQGVFAVPAGSWEYKAALNDSWDENYGADATRDGANIGLSLADPTDVKFYYDHETHWITDNQSSVIATLAGSYQSELGCPGDWDPGCLRSWLQDPDGDGLYLFSTTAIPAGAYEVKVAINETWEENYGEGGVQNGPNIPFTVAVEDSTAVFSYDPATHFLSISVLAPNTPPVANSDSATTLEDTPVTVDVLANDVDSDGDMLSVATATDGTWGETAPITSLDTITYTPDPDYHGSDSFTYMVCDTHGACDWGTVFVTVTAVNDPPVANDDAYTIDEDTILTVAAPGVLGNDTDVDGDPLQGAGWTWYDPFGGTANVYLDGSFQFVPDPDFCGESVWTYQATDGIAQSDWADVTITVNCVNDPPTADANGSYVGTIGAPVTFDGTGSSDPENGVETFDWDFDDGSLAGTDAGATPTHTYTTAAVYAVTLTVTDDGGLTNTATTSVAITLGSESFDAVEATIEGMGLESAGFENSLLKKIQNAQKSFDKADGEVCEKLASFIAAVNAQDGKKLTPEQADLLRSQAEAISDAHGCDT